MGQNGLLVLALVALGCQSGEECTKARLAASDAWKTVMSQAGNTKVSGWPGYEDLSEAQKVESVNLWKSVETQSEMIFKSFAYERITWKTSDPAREEANRQFAGFVAKDSFALFAAALKTANLKYDAASKVCRK